MTTTTTDAFVRRAQLEQTARDVVVNGKRVGDYASLWDNPRHSHSNDNLVGYVVVETVDPELGALWRHKVDGGHTTEPVCAGSCGWDVAVIDAANRYADAF